MRAKLPFLVVLILAALSLARCGGGEEEYSSTSDEGSPATKAGSSANSEGRNAQAPSGEAVRAAKVEIADYAYEPDPVRIQVGGKVTWQNEDSVAHTATADDGSFDTGPIEEGKIKSETFKKAGTFTYICSIHPQMKGTVEVVEKG